MIAHCLVCQATGGFSLRVTFLLFLCIISIKRLLVCAWLKSLVKAISRFVDQQELSECFCPADPLAMLREGCHLHANKFSECLFNAICAMGGTVQ